MITLKNLDKFYPVGPGRYYVLRRITMDIAEGEFRNHHGSVRSREDHAPEHSGNVGWRLGR